MEQTQQTKQNWSLVAAIQSISTVGIGITALCYILGLLIVSIYHAQYGLYSKELLRTEYIFSGAVLLLLIAIAEMNFTFIRIRAADVSQAWQGKKYFSCIVPVSSIVFSILMIPFAFALLTFDEIISIKELGGPMTGIASVWTMTYVTGLNVNWRNAIKAITNNDANDNAERTTALRSLFMPIFLVFIGIATYSSMTYQHISAAFGGGHRTPAILFPNVKGMEVSKALALPIQNDKTVGPVEIVSESDNELTILIVDELTGKKVAVRLNKQLLDAIQTKSSYRYGKT